MTETGAVIFASLYAFVISYLMLILINKFTLVRVDDVEQENGVDEVIHGEHAYFM
jgi:ammonia channel protein AmtB